MKIGGQTHWHHLYGKNRYLLGKCYSCNRKIYLNAWEHIVDFIYKENNYCSKCIIQVKNGIDMPKYETKKRIVKCLVCGIEIDTIYYKTPYCKDHLPEWLKNRFEFNKEVKKEAHKTLYKKEEKSDFTRFGRLKKDLGFCCSVACPNKGKSFPRDLMFGVKRKNVSQDRMYFCSDSCRNDFLNIQENKGLIFTKLSPKIILPFDKMKGGEVYGNP